MLRRLASDKKDGRTPGNLHLCLCETYLKQNRLTEAREQIALAARSGADEAPLLLSEGNVYLASKDYKEALTKYENKVHLTPMSSDGYLGKARVYQKQKQYSLALETLATARTLVPDDSDIEIVLGNVMFDQGDYNAALECYQRARDLAPNKPGIEYGIGRAYLNQGNYGEAIRILKGLLKDSPFNTDAMYGLALAEMQGSNEKEAIKLLRAAISIRASDVAYYVLLTKAYLSSGRWLSALQTARQARRIARATHEN